MKLTEHIYLVGSGCMGLSAQGDCNVYAVESRGEILLIDSGLDPDPSRILQNLAADGLNPSAIRGLLLTHVHPDHAGGLPALQKQGIPVLCGNLSARILREGLSTFYPLHTLPESPFRTFFEGTPRAAADRILEDGESVPVGDLSLQMIAVPAHSPDSVCYLLRMGEEAHLFTGDTLFYPGHINYFSSVLSQADGYPEVIRRLAAISPDGLYPGHALCTITRGRQCTDSALEWIQKGVLPPLKPYS